MSPSRFSAKNTIYHLVVEFLGLLKEPMKRVIRFASIPNVFNAPLLQEMTGEQAGIVEILEMLQQHYFINTDEGEWYSFSSDIREIIHAFWEQPEQREQFQKTNHIAWTYFADLANKTNPPEVYFFQREALYHRLLEDEYAGLEYMADLFEHACDQRQIGAAQSFSIQLAQTLPHLSPIANQYLLYYEMRLDFMLNRREKLEANLEILINKTSDPLLRARAGILLGQVWVARYEWKKSADILRNSLRTVEKLGAWRDAARAMLALGELYVDLVESSGGVQPESTSDLSKLSQLLTHLLFLPFLLLDWLRRKIWFLPGWFYFGGNYQEWILNYLLQMAGSWYRKAWHVARKVADEATSLNALLGQANVAVQQRHEAKAERIYSRLARLPAVYVSRYRLAQVEYGQGQVSLLANRATQASQRLQAALNIFQSYVDEANIGMAARSLGETYAKLADHEAAAQAFLESLRAYLETQDPVSQTQVSWELQMLIEKKKISSSMEQQISDALSHVHEKQYVARYPSDLLRRFRALAYSVALPLSYLLILFVGLAIFMSLIAIESSALQVSNTGSLSQADALFLVVVGILPIFLSFWIIELVYAVLGQAWVFLVGHISLNTLGEQPDVITLTSEAVIVESPGLREPIRLAWNEIEKLVSADYRLWQRPIYLFSRQGLVGNGKSIIIDGITSGYIQIRKEVIQRIGGLVNQLNADTVILIHPTTYIAVLFAILHAQLLVSVGQIYITAENANSGDIGLSLTSWLVFFLVDIMMILPPLLLWRIHLRRRFFSQQLGKRPRQLLNFATSSITILLAIGAILWVFLSMVLKINAD